MNMWVWRLLPMVSVVTTLPLLMTTGSYGQTCTPISVQQAVAQLQNNQKRPQAQITLKQCVHSLENALSDADAKTRLYAAETLGQIGWEAKAVVPSLVSAAKEDTNTEVRDKAVAALNQIVQDSKKQSAGWQGWQTGEIKQLKVLKQQLDDLRAALEKDKKEWQTKAKDLYTLELANRQLGSEIEQFSEQPSYQVVFWGQNHPWIVVIGVGVVLLVTAYGAVFWLYPLGLLKLGDGLIQPIANLPHVGTALSGVLKVLLPLKYHPRVLDAWVEGRFSEVKTAFSNIKTVKDRQLHIALPVCLDQEQEERFLSSNDLEATFQKRTAVLLITGEGGSGKTSLACKIAQWGLEKKLAPHRLLPILIETELDEKKTLMEAIRGQLHALTNEQDEIPTNLLEKLLQRQRLLVIVDHFSEMGEATRKQVMPELADFKPKALVITSRLDEFSDVSKTILKPLRIEADRLLGFMQAYVHSRLNNQDDPFIDDEYAAACDRLRRMVGQRNITVLLARLYAEQMIEQQQGAGGVLPASVPELMLCYLNQLNGTIEQTNRRDSSQVRQEAQVIAWECLRQTYRPTVALRKDVVLALESEQTDDNTASGKLDYLEKRLRLVETLEPGDKMRIVLDPLAEYLAASYLVEKSRIEENREAFWQEFFDSIEQILQRSNDPPQAIQGFLLAVRDCCLIKQKEARIPDGVAEELAQRAGLDPKELQREEERRRIRVLISELSAPELKYRLRAAEDLGQWGGDAKIAAPNLIGMLENRNQELEARQAAAQALGKLGIGDGSLLKLLTDSTEELEVRRSAAEALGMMKMGQVELRQLLESEAQHLPVRQGAARALSLIGASSGEPVPMLIVELKAGEVIRQVKSIPVWKEPLMEGLTLDLVEIPGGEFLMGSPADEEGRDWYEYVYPELKGVDVEAQHRVTLPSFFMSQYPITQAQWRFVAALPKIKWELAPDPANFKVDNRPVEQVSWHDVMEFCARLSQHTNKTYRLPSEAEWEYGCRAGTTQPFHLGDTLSTDFANYDGNYIYSNGSKGKFRQKTTEIGSFGVVNAFGLSDMHGNVWEWCLDYWHPSYQGAPTDGSAWVTDGDERYRLLRGGSWYFNPEGCRAACRNRRAPGGQGNGYGFRVVCVPPWTV